MKPTKDGRKLWKRVVYKIIIDDKVNLQIGKAPMQRGYTEENIQEATEHMIEWVDKTYPGIEFNLVQIAPNEFNFIKIGERAVVPVIDSEAPG